MDPNKCLELLEAAVARRDGAAVREHAQDLMVWLRKGGFKCSRRPLEWDGDCCGASMWQVRMLGTKSKPYAVLIRGAGMDRREVYRVVVWEDQDHVA